MFCKKCGTEIRPGAKFCVKCGTPVKVQEAGQPKKDAAVERQPETEMPRQSGNKGIIVVLICIIILLLGAGAAMFFYFNGQDSRQEDTFESQDEPKRDRTDDLNDDADQTAQDRYDEGDDQNVPDDGKEAQISTEQTTETEYVAAQDDTEDASQKVHTYQIITADVTWTEAYQAAKNIPNGHLVNIDTEDEWNTIVKLIEEQGYSDRIFWIGAMRRGDSQEYYWIDREGKNVGSAINESSHWLSGEPTFYDSENNLEEQYVEMFHSSKQDAWVWNDTPDDLLSLISYYSGKMAYIVEIEN